MDGDISSLIGIIESGDDISSLRQYNFYYPVFILSILCLNKDDKINLGDEEPFLRTFNYLTRIGFYDILGIKGAPIKKNKADSLMEITKISGKYDDRVLDKKIVDFRDKIMLKMGFSGEKENESKYYSLNLFLVELIRNVVNHSSILNNGGHSYFMFQSYDETVNISIVDTGIGIKESFRQSSFWDESKGTKYYMDLAFERGKTSNADVGAGNGLYFSKELVRLTDSKFSIISGDLAYTLSGNSESYNDISGYWQGVIIDLHINLNKIKEDKVLELFGGVYPGYIAHFDELDDLFL